MIFTTMTLQFIFLQKSRKLAKLIFQSLTWPYSANSKDFKIILSQSVLCIIKSILNIFADRVTKALHSITPQLSAKD